MSDELREKIVAELQAELGYAGLSHERAADRILAILREGGHLKPKPNLGHSIKVR